MLNDEKLKINSNDPFMVFLIIHNSSFIISSRPPAKTLILVVLPGIDHGLEILYFGIIRNRAAGAEYKSPVFAHMVN